MLLAIETAHSACSVAVIEGGEVVAALHEEIGRGHAERLVPMVAEVLAQAASAAPSAILVDVGPGSFTGVRVGLAAARALGFAWNCRVDGFTGDAAVARTVFARPGAPERVLIVLDALRGEVFAREWTQAGPVGSIATLTRDGASALARESGAAAGSGVTLIGPLPAWSDPRAPHAAEARLLAPGDRVAPTPLYIRAPDVERAA